MTNPPLRGQIILLALVFFAVFLTITTALISYVFTYNKSERQSVYSGQALALAEAGIDEAAAKLNTDTSYTGESNVALGGGVFTVTVSTVDANTKTVTAVGYVPNATHPVATKTVKVNLGIDPNVVSFRYGVQTGAGGFTLSGGSTINGSVYSNGDISATTGVHITGSAIAANPAATTTDQENDTPSTIASCTSSTCITFANASATQDFAQSFKVSTAQPLNSIQFYIKKVGSPGDETVRIVTDTSGSPSNTTLMTGTLSAASITTNFGWVGVTMPSTPVLDPDQTYWIVLDGASNASKYYIIGANSGGYASGAAKTGAYGGSWTSTSGLDGYFQIYLGGGTSMIGGNSYTTGVYVGTASSDTAWAHTVQGATVSGTIYCQVASFTNKPCTTSQGDPTPQTMPLSDNNIQDWKDDAVAGGTTNGDVTVGFAGASIGPKKIVGNLTVNGGGTLNVTGTIWVTGTVTVTGGGKVQLDPSYGSKDGVIVTDGYVALSGGATFAGSGQSGSYPFLITTSACPVAAGCNGNDAISLNGGAGTVALVAQDGTVHISGGSSLKAVTAKQIAMDGGATLTYDSGLVNANFSSGPGGSWKIISGTYSVAN